VPTPAIVIETIIGCVNFFFLMCNCLNLQEKAQKKLQEFGVMTNVMLTYALANLNANLKNFPL
jgi:hypothetical protein